MRKFFGEFKKFITRGNVLDMAVGVIVGGAFTAIVNSVSNNVLKPLINALLAWVFGKNSLEELYTYVPSPVYAADGTIDLANSIYIDWGALINAVINFLITAFVLFLIVRLVNNLKDKQSKVKAAAKKGQLTKEQKKELKAHGIKRSDKAAVEAFLAEKAAAEAAAKAEAEAKAAAEKAANPTSEELLKQIVELLKTKA